MSDLLSIRADKDRFFAVSRHSPLTNAQKHGFEGLRYFAEDDSLRLELPLEEFPEKTPLQLQTTTGDTQTYVRYGRIAFHVDGKEAELTVFASSHGLFLPFADALAGETTYAAGRYLEPEFLGDGRLLVDFNLAYNPYCAYNDAWSCPITPRENRLTLSIRAGEMVFHP